jgi:hypothetical protein
MPGFTRALLSDGPAAGAVVKVPLDGSRLPRARIGVAVPVLDETAETLDWRTAAYFFPPVQDIPPRPGGLWRYSYSRMVG